MTEAENENGDIENAAKIKKNEYQNEVKKSKRKYPGFRKNLLDYFQEFTGNTGVHGFKYMGEQDRTLCEKFWWVILFCISLYVCIDLIIKTWTKWDQSPVLVSFAKSPTPVWQVPFPAVTICSETKTRQTVYNFTNAFDQFIHGENMTVEEMKRFSDSSLICDNHLYNEGEKFTKVDTIDYLMSVAPQFNDVFFSCKWTLLNESCENLFTPILTEEGLCFTFNMLDRTELLRNKVHIQGDYMSHGSHSEGWTLGEGYPKHSKKDTFPRRAMSAGYSAGLFLVLKASTPDLDYICKGPVQGFKILLHHPAEVPRVSRQFFRAPLDQEVVVSVRPDMMTTSEGLLSYNPQRRQCYFPSERYLSFYQSYTQQNCQIECLTNFTLAKCGCVAYHMPREKHTKICGSGSQVCMFQAQTKLLELEVDSGLKNMYYALNQSISTCDCLPACTSLTYNAEFSQAKFEWKKLFQAYRVNISGEFPGIQMTRLTFFFKEQQFITSERNELYGQTDFLANCGGILGLFTGFSFLSIVEILYFLTLRLMCNVKHYGRHYWSGSPRLVEDEDYVHPKRRQ
ncbi:unnamed protein product [Psylliodes chrysocephalus]|uniref:Uncharacterized protein n=1 Tax=Psylliodes chrysocephalus TaxID=3402493 RepID=A0A9P0C969_9CUCU|nr:unnamed protein product [Psylliodes chrysocephala]